MKFQLIVLMLCMILLQCKNHEVEKAVDAANSTVMTLHDETMANHGEIMELTSKLKEKGKDTAAFNITLIDSIRTELDGLNEDMMDWMSNYEEPEAKDTSALNYLEKQILTLKAMKESQSKNIEIAKALLSK